MLTSIASNILDIPDFFWESEPLLRPLHEAVREYLEIAPRIQVLNERCEVFLDLTEILSDSIADSKMMNITWIIIVLIIISIAVTVSEVGLRFGMLSRINLGEGPKVVVANHNFSRADFSVPQLEAICGMPIVGKTFADL